MLCFYCIKYVNIIYNLIYYFFIYKNNILKSIFKQFVNIFMFRKGFFAEAICEFNLGIYYKNISSGSHHINLHIKKVGNNIPYL